MSLADKCIVVGCFACRDYDKIFMETGKFSNNTRVTENGLVSILPGKQADVQCRLRHR